jgi:flagellar basal body-associated protein FliL
MDVMWISLIAVLLVAGVAGCLIVRRFETREKAWQLVEAEKAEAEEKQKPPFQIPVLRDKPRINASDVDPTAGLDPDFSWDGKDK